MNAEPREPHEPSAAKTDEAAPPPAMPPADPVSPPANELTPEEQMARFEQELKENDWGHQPC
jgi:hypothetical protein